MHGKRLRLKFTTKIKLFKGNIEKINIFADVARRQSSYLGTQAVDVSPSGASGAGQQNWCSTVWFLCERGKQNNRINGRDLYESLPVNLFSMVMQHRAVKLWITPHAETVVKHESKECTKLCVYRLWQVHHYTPVSHLASAPVNPLQDCQLCPIAVAFQSFLLVFARMPLWSVVESLSPSRPSPSGLVGHYVWFSRYKSRNYDYWIERYHLYCTSAVCACFWVRIPKPLRPPYWTQTLFCFSVWFFSGLPDVAWNCWVSVGQVGKGKTALLHELQQSP